MTPSLGNPKHFHGFCVRLRESGGRVTNEVLVPGPS